MKGIGFQPQAGSRLQRISPEDFTIQDKQTLLELFLLNESAINEIFRLTFPKQSDVFLKDPVTPVTYSDYKSTQADRKSVIEQFRQLNSRNAPNEVNPLKNRSLSTLAHHVSEDQLSLFMLQQNRQLPAKKKLRVRRKESVEEQRLLSQI